MALNKDSFITVAAAGMFAMGGAGIRGLSRELSHSSGHVSKEVSEATHKFVGKEASQLTHPPRHYEGAVEKFDFPTAAIARIAATRLPSFEELSDGAKPLNHNYRDDNKSTSPQRPILPLVIDLRTRTNPIQDQGPEGSCTAYATVAAMETWIHTHTDLQLKLSEASLWSMYKKQSSHAAIKSAAGESSSYVSITTINGFPSVLENWRVILDLPTTRFDLKGTQEVLEQVALKNPVVMATEVNQSFYDTKDGWIRTDGPSANKGHAFTVVGYRLFPDAPQQSYLIIRNSWGTKWGDHGYGYLPLAYCEKYKCIGHAITKVRFINLNDLPNSERVIR